MNEKKKYEKPVAEVMDFAKEDIITVSSGDVANWDGEEWENQ